MGSIQLGVFSLLFPLPILAESGQQSLPQEPVDRRSFRRNLSDKIKAKKKKDFILKTGLWYFFPFCIQYTVIQTSQYYIQIHNIFKKPVLDEHFKRTRFCNAPVGREKVSPHPPAPSWPLRREMSGSVYVSWLIGSQLSWPPGRKTAVLRTMSKSENVRPSQLLP